jgi:hypothetical protein
MLKTALKAALMTLLAMPTLAQSRSQCSQPVILKLTQQNGKTLYQLDSEKPHERYSLGAVSKAVRLCSPDRPIFVVATSDVPMRFLHLPGKEEISTDRYFIEYPDGAVQEIKFDLLFPRLPITSDVVGTAPTIEENPPPINTMKR